MFNTVVTHAGGRQAVGKVTLCVCVCVCVCVCECLFVCLSVRLAAL